MCGTVEDARGTPSLVYIVSDEAGGGCGDGRGEVMLEVGWSGTGGSVSFGPGRGAPSL